MKSGLERIDTVDLVDVRCPRCGRLQFRIAKLARILIERKCRCRAMLVITENSIEVKP